MSEQMLCPSCNGEMVRGFVIDRDRGTKTLSLWYGGEPTMAKALGMPVTGNVRSEFPGVPLAAFRCSSCGLIEWYARDEFGVQ